MCFGALHTTITRPKRRIVWQSRQIFLTEEGTPLDHHITVGWTDDHQKTYFLRDKEGADDYRYFPEPDLPPLVITPDFIEQLQKTIPELPTEKQNRYQTEWKLSVAEATFISSDADLAKFFEEVIAGCNDPKKAATFVATILVSRLKEEGINIKETKITAASLAKLITLINEGKVSMNIAKNEVFEMMYKEGSDPEKFIQEQGLAVVSDTVELEKICKQVIAENAKSIEDYKNGKKQAFFFLIGQVMKATKGKANAQTVTEMMEKLLK